MISAQNGPKTVISPGHIAPRCYCIKSQQVCVNIMSIFLKGSIFCVEANIGVENAAQEGENLTK